MAGPFGLILKQELMGHEHDGKQKRKMEQREQCMQRLRGEKYTVIIVPRAKNVNVQV